MPSASATIEVINGQIDDGALGTIASEPEVQNQIVLLISEETLIKVLHEPEVLATTWYEAFQGDKAAALDAMSAMISVQSPPGSGRIHLTVHADDGDVALTILKHWVAIYLVEVERHKNNSLRRARRAYLSDLGMARNNIVNTTHDIHVLEQQGHDTDDADYVLAHETLERILQMEERRRDNATEHLADIAIVLGRELNVRQLKSPTLDQP